MRIFVAYFQYLRWINLSFYRNPFLLVYFERQMKRKLFMREGKFQLFLNLFPSLSLLSADLQIFCFLQFNKLNFLPCHGTQRHKGKRKVMWLCKKLRVDFCLMLKFANSMKQNQKIPQNLFKITAKTSSRGKGTENKIKRDGKVFLFSPWDIHECGDFYASFSFPSSSFGLAEKQTISQIIFIENMWHVIFPPPKYPCHHYHFTWSNVKFTVQIEWSQQESAAYSMSSCWGYQKEHSKIFYYFMKKYWNERGEISTLFPRTICHKS